MKVKILKKWDSQLLKEAMRDFLFNFRGEEQGYLVFEGNFGFGIPNNQLSMGAREIRKFATELKVEGGTKSVENNWIFVKPLHTRRVYLRFPEEHYKLLEYYAKKLKKPPSMIIKDAVGEKLFQLEKTRKKSEKEGQAVGYA